MIRQGWFVVVVVFAFFVGIRSSHRRRHSHHHRCSNNRCRRHIRRHSGNVFLRIIRPAGVSFERMAIMSFLIL